MSGLIEVIWILISASAFNLLYAVFIKVYKETQALHRSMCSWKREDSFSSLSR